MKFEPFKIIILYFYFGKISNHKIDNNKKIIKYMVILFNFINIIYNNT